MLNINWGRNKELMSSCKPLSEYSIFTADVRQLYSDTGDKDFAVETAIRNLPEDSEIRAFMEENMAEVKEMCLTEYDDEREKEILKEQYLEAGFDGFISKPIVSGKLEQALLERLPKELIKPFKSMEFAGISMM